MVRLAFAVQAHVEPNVLIVDEVLSVGDIFFQQKCHARLEELLAGGTALLFVSHDMGTVEKYCSKALLLNGGQSLFCGKPHEAVAHYYYLGRYGSLKHASESRKKIVATRGNAHNSPLENWPPEANRVDLSNATVVGETSVARCTAAITCDLEGQPCATFEMGETAVFYYEFEILQDILVPVGGVTIITSKNIPIHSKNSLQHMVTAPDGVSQGSRVRFRQTIKS